MCVFSESEDQLSQWRGYAQNGKGLAIGFDKRILEELNLINEYNIAFGKVIYNDTEAYVQDIVQDNIEKFQCKSLVHVALELCQDYRLKFPFMKKPGFEEKKEWRGIVCSRIGNYNIPCSEQILFSKIKYIISIESVVIKMEIYI